MNEKKHLTTAAGAPAPDVWRVQFDAKAMPDRTWKRDPAAKNTLVELRDGALLIADRGTADGEACYFRNPLTIGGPGESVIEARVKVISGVSALIFGDGTTGQRLCFYPDRVEFYHNRAVKLAMDTTTDFHVYRLVIRGEDIQLAVDGQYASRARSAAEIGDYDIHEDFVAVGEARYAVGFLAGADVRLVVDIKSVVSVVDDALAESMRKTLDGRDIAFREVVVAV